MATDLKITLDNLPGELARLGETLGNAGVNIEGIVGVAGGDKGEIHIVVEDADAATAALSAAGITVDAAREVAVTSCNDAPGELGRVTRRLADAGVNIDLAFLATGTRLVVGADDIEKLKSAL